MLDYNVKTAEQTLTHWLVSYCKEHGLQVNVDEARNNYFVHFRLDKKVDTNKMFIAKSLKCYDIVAAFVDTFDGGTSFSVVYRLNIDYEFSFNSVISELKYYEVL